MNTLTEAQVKRALARLTNGWPRDLWIFSANGDLHLMRTDSEGDRIYHPNVPGEHGMSGGGVDAEQVIRSYRIPSDGGDW